MKRWRRLFVALVAYEVILCGVMVKYPDRWTPALPAMFLIAFGIGWVFAPSEE